MEVEKILAKMKELESTHNNCLSRWRDLKRFLEQDQPQTNNANQHELLTFRDKLKRAWKRAIKHKIYIMGP